MDLAEDLPIHCRVLLEHSERIDGLLDDAGRLQQCGLVAEGLRSLLDAVAILGEYTDVDRQLIPDG